MGAHTTTGRVADSIRRAAAVIGIGVLTVVALPAAALAVPAGDTCDADPAGYGPPGTCAITAEVVSECRGGLPVLRYAATVDGVAAAAVDVRWSNPAGTDVVETGLPLSGEVVWPGTVLNADGEVITWPGWVLQADGTLVRGGDHEWARSTVNVSFTAGPAVSVAVDYPPDPSCDGVEVRVLSTSVTSGSAGTNGTTDTTGATEGTAVTATSAQMAATGFDGMALAGGAAALIVVGGGLAGWAMRRRRRESTQV